MIISVINHAHASITDAEIQPVLRALNRQIEGDFAPYWSLGAQLRLEGRSGKQPSKQSLSDMRGDAVLYLWDKVDVDDALGYHEINHRGIPFGFVFTELSKAMGEHWSVTFSHEALELIADPEVNLLVAGPHPLEPGRDVFHWYEMCDAVQAETYPIDNVEVSNFVLPLYFTIDAEKGSRNDFLGARHAGSTLRSFGVNPGGYVGFYDPLLQAHDTYMMQGDALAKDRMAIKQTLKRARRANRYLALASAPRKNGRNHKKPRRKRS